MAISIVNGNRGTATEKVSDQTLTLTPNGNLAAGNYALLAVVIDNTGTAEGQTTDLSVTDNGPGATWVRFREQTEANTAALTGVTCALFMAHLPYPLTTAHTVSIAIAANSTAKGAGLAELSVAAGSQLVESASGDNGTNAAGATSYSVALSGLTNVAGLYVGMAAAENEVDAAVTLDAAYAALGFGSIGSGNAGLATSNVIARVGTLANTSTGDTFDAAALTSSDRATILVRLEEYTPPFIADPVSINIASDEVDAVYHRQIEKRNSSGFIRVPVLGEPFVEPLARPVVVRLSTSPALRKGMAVHPRLSAPAAIDLSPQTSFLSVALVASPLAGRATNVRLAPPSVVEDAPLFIADGLQLNLARTQARASVVRSFLTAFDETTVPPEPPEPPAQPAYPTSPPPPRLGGGSAW